VLGLQWFIGFTGCAGLIIFLVVFHRVREELTIARSRGMPLAVVARRGGPARSEARLRSRLADTMPAVQASLVATAATSVLVMGLCLLACLVLAVLGR
jgi:hypothetical protein